MAEVEARVTGHDIVEWVAEWRLRNEEEKAAYDKAAKRTR